MYITATLLKPHLDNEIPLTVAHGLLSLPVEDTIHRIPIEILAPAKSGSDLKQKISIKTKPNTAYTIAIVDEGILQIKNYKSPDPYTYFFGERSLGVESYEVYPELMPGWPLTPSLSGGDGRDIGKRINPLAGQRVNLVSYWSAIKKSDARGLGEVDIDIPHFSGDLRIMCVAYNGPDFGAAQSNMKIADPVVISSAIPRFLSHNDAIDIGVLLSNTTDKEISGIAKITGSGPIHLSGESQQSVTLKPGQEKRVVFKAQADQATGLSEVVVSFEGGGKTYKETIKLPIRAAASLQKRAGFGRIEPGAEQTIALPDDIIPDTRSVRLIVSASPAMELGRSLEYLLRYPHGCVEQTISTAFPQLFLADLITNPTTNRDPAAEVRYNVQQAITKLQTMQNYNGALTYWPGGKPDWWASIFGLHFLTEAKKAGYEVQDNMTKGMEDFLNRKIRNTDKISYYIGNNQYREYYPREIPYTLFVMALRGKPNFAAMNKLKGEMEGLTTDSQFLLGAAMALSGQKSNTSVFYSGNFDDYENYKSSAGSYYSYIRDMGISLNALLSADPTNPAIIPLARKLTQSVNSSEWMNTQEHCFSLLALGKLAHQIKPGAKAKFIFEGREIASFEEKTLQITNDELHGNIPRIMNDGSQPVFYYWEAEGQSNHNLTDQKENGLKMRKTVYNRFGKKVDLTKIKSNELLVIELAVSSTIGSILKNVVITDLLPGGWEIENPRLNEVPQVGWIKESDVPDHFDIYDDRIFLYTNIDKKPLTFYYLARAVSPGSYFMGQASADAMYNDEYYAYAGAGKVVVK